MKPETISKVKLLGLVIGVAVVAAVLAALAQVVILGKSNAGVTGGVVGAISAGIAVSIRNKKSASG